MRSLFTGLLLFSFVSLKAQEQRALIIGIDHYAPPAGYKPTDSTGRKEYADLKGSVNDAMSILSVITSRFNFQQKNIDTLFNEKATRDGILKSMQDLLSKSKSGDLAFLYYAGHGSRMKNSLSFEVSKMDQTIVPSNTWQQGVSDIRDKELAKLFNDFLDKGVKLTVIFDCCHSGSITRGPNIAPETFRYIPMSNLDSRDPSRYPIPETRSGDNFLIYASAQADELAAEQDDDNMVRHGAFTVALLQALNQLSADASALTIFSSARAILKSNGKKQEPIIGGTQTRQQQTLFGLGKGKVTDFTYVAVSRIVGPTVILQGGYALGLLKDNELAMFNDKQDTVFKLRVDSITGINSCYASLIKGDLAQLKPGYQFRVTNWVSSKRPLLRIYLPRNGPSTEAVMKFAAIADQLKQSSKTKWMESIRKGSAEPFTTVFWKNNTCYVKTDQSPAMELKDPSAEKILEQCTKDSTLYVEFPLSASNAELFYTQLSENKGLEMVDDPATAHYILFGKRGPNGLPAYGFRKAEVAVRDSLESIPLFTDTYEWSNAQSANAASIAGELNTMALKLAKLRGWLNLMVPDATKKGLGYHLEFYSEDRKSVIRDGWYRIGEKVTMKLMADSNLATQFLKQKYVYIFAVDQSGSMNLFFPEDDGNVANKLPITVNGDAVKEYSIISYEVPAPSGTDNFFVLACEDPIANPSMLFNQAGVATARAAGNNNPLADLINMGNTGSRDAKKIPANWSVQRYSFRCVY